MSKIGNNIEQQRYLLIIDITPDIGPVPSFTHVTWRGRVLNLHTFRTTDRIAAFINDLTKSMRDLQRSNTVKFNFRWSIALVDRVTGRLIEGNYVSNLKIGGDPKPSDVNSVVIPAGTPEANEANRLKRMYNAILDKSRLQPTLIRGEDPFDMLRQTLIKYNIIEIPAYAVEQPITADKIKMAALTINMWKEEYDIPSFYPQDLRQHLVRLPQIITEAVSILRGDAQRKIADMLNSDEDVSVRDVRQAEITALQIDRKITAEDPSFRSSMVNMILNNRLDCSDDRTPFVVAQSMRPYFNGLVMETATPLVTPLYMSRDLLNGEDIVAWARSQGFPSCFNPADMHVTQLYSKTPVDWTTITPDPNGLRVTGGARRIKVLGDKGAMALTFDSPTMAARQTELLQLGASSDFVGFLAHSTFTYKGLDMDLARIQPYQGVLQYGPEKMKEIKEEFDPGELREIDLTN